MIWKVSYRITLKAENALIFDGKIFLKNKSVTKKAASFFTIRQLRYCVYLKE